MAMGLFETPNDDERRNSIRMGCLFGPIGQVAYHTYLQNKRLSKQAGAETAPVKAAKPLSTAQKRSVGLIVIVLLCLVIWGSLKKTGNEYKGFRIAYTGETLAESVGIETLGGIFTPVIKKGSQIPVTVKEVFSTAADNQSSVEIHVLTGNADLAKDNRSIGRFYIVGIRPAPRAVPQIEVAYIVDSNGALTVKAKDLDTGKENEIRIPDVPARAEK
jgi:molecular chaperone DnaK (HSP70)